MPKVMCLYMDDSGTRNPDKKIADDLTYKDWFALGGILMKEEDDGQIVTQHAKFCETWGITYPLRSYDIRLWDKRFSWLRTLSAEERGKFMRGLGDLLTGIPVIGYAAVIDRPGYNARYREKYGRQTWQLCQTAFSVICERAAKRARSEGCKLRVFVEEGDKTADGHVRQYYSDLRTKGMPFDTGNMKKYAPMTQEELADTLYDLRFRTKKSPLMQIADVYLYPMARGGYDPNYTPYQMLRTSKKLIDDLLSEEETPHLGIKYSCFEMVEKARERAKSKKASRKTGS
ncbi:MULTISPECIES: DUF3800 domain-containing protein [Bradyrhizobium]|uniref:DUF3800 domain-containing protein n=4 Tax=Nitrobacteraceae TaxID=41294 RepID=A0A809YBA5_9BRAD|nr:MULTISPECIES: DUF3800 domain-containing protein [Bradyrhizobium]AWL91461.1 DUF3800 domain-containing protein [Bradyrhizobium ottawaense]MBR1292399.1 DUF3800 domain-containing protein [Bradyrhizobium ottawaense]MCD9112446.1 DUF3800 domain-containing protein [Bradyrhizobium japonicum]MCS3980597.1 hypothetical protein [Bradyrhizobium japonicum]UQD74426.1 DUF3800 domain-containing protein [Bradyrhizobium japonicum]